MVLDPKSVEVVARALAADELGMGDPPAVVETIVNYQWRAFEKQAITAITAYLQHAGEGEAEPVAWRVRERPGFDWRLTTGDPERDPRFRGQEIQPLFAAPHPHHEPDPEGWQPPETAPKDGTRILACWTPRNRDPDYGVIWWEDGIWREGSPDNPVDGFDEWRHLPLPASPSNQASASADLDAAYPELNTNEV